MLEKNIETSVDQVYINEFEPTGDLKKDIETAVQDFFDTHSLEYRFISEFTNEGFIDVNVLAVRHFVFKSVADAYTKLQEWFERTPMFLQRVMLFEGKPLTLKLSENLGYASSTISELKQLNRSVDNHMAKDLSDYYGHTFLPFSKDEMRTWKKTFNENKLLYIEYLEKQLHSLDNVIDTMSAPQTEEHMICIEPIDLIARQDAYIDKMLGMLSHEEIKDLLLQLMRGDK